MIPPTQLVSYIAPAAPATRRPARGNEPFLRPEIGFTPQWFRQSLDIEFGETWHTDPAIRAETITAMRAELRRRFAGSAIGGIDRSGDPPDLLTGTYGACSIAAIYGVPVLYARDNWPNCARQYLTDDQADRLESPDLDSNEHFQQLMRQVDWIVDHVGPIHGFINWQGVLNNAQRLRGQQLFLDMMDNPQRAQRIFRCVATTMRDAAKRLHQRQKASGVSVEFFTVSNCLVNMISPRDYETHLLPWDRFLAESFGCLGLHNCAWSATPYLDAYAQLAHLAYLDMGIDSDLERACTLFPRARRALMYTPMHLRDKSWSDVEADIRRIADLLGPCDLVIADIEANTPDDRIHRTLALCDEISRDSSQHA